MSTSAWAAGVGWCRCACLPGATRSAARMRRSVACLDERGLGAADVLGLADCGAHATGAAGHAVENILPGIGMVGSGPQAPLRAVPHLSQCVAEGSAEVLVVADSGA